MLGKSENGQKSQEALGTLHLCVGNWGLDGAFVTIISVEGGWGVGEGKGQASVSLGLSAPCPPSPPTLRTFLLPQQRHVTSSMDQLTRMLDCLHQEVRLAAPSAWWDHAPGAPSRAPAAARRSCPSVGWGDRFWFLSNGLHQDGKMDSQEGDQDPREREGSECF